VALFIPIIKKDFIIFTGKVIEKFGAYCIDVLKMKKVAWNTPIQYNYITILLQNLPNSTKKKIKKRFVCLLANLKFKHK